MLWQQRRWRTLLNLIDHLPGASHFGEALVNDEEAARAWLASSQETTNRGPKFAEYDPLVARLDVLVDRMGELIRVGIASGGGKAPKVPAQIRPRTGIDRVRDQIRETKHNDLVKRLLPNRDN